MTKLSSSEIACWKFPGGAQGVDWEETFSIQLPEKIYPSTEGHLVKCSYSLDIELDVPMAIDLCIRPRVVIALLPAYGEGQWFLQDMEQIGKWTSF